MQQRDMNIGDHVRFGDGTVAQIDRIVRASVYIMEPDVELRVVSVNGDMVYEIEHTPDGATVTDVYATPSAIPTPWMMYTMYALVNNMHDCTGYWECVPM